MINKAALDPNSRKRLKVPLFEPTPLRLAQNAAFHKVLNQIYKMIDSSSKLLWAADNSIRGKPRRSQSDKSESNWKQETNACLGYGQLTKNLSFYIQQRPDLKNKLLYEPEEYDLKETSTFLDIGSGFGKPVFHAALQTGCLSHGIEVVPARVEFCIDFYFEYLATFKLITKQALSNSDHISGEEEALSPSVSSPRKPYTRQIADYEQQMRLFDLKLELAQNQKRGELFDKWIKLNPEYTPQEAQLEELNKRELTKLFKQEFPLYHNLDYMIQKEFGSYKPSSIIIPKMYRYQEQTRSRKSRLMKARQQKAKEKREQTKRELHYTALLKDSWLDNLKFFKKDAALVDSFELEEEQAQKQYYSHVYSYNKVMSEHDLCEICKALNETKYRVLSWYWGPKATRKFGLRNFIYLHKMTMQSTGGQKFTAFIYLRSNETETEEDSSEEEGEEAEMEGEEEEVDDYSDNFDLND